MDFSISIFWSPTKTRMWSAMLCYVPAARGLIPRPTRYGGNPAANCGRGKRDKETLNGKMWTQKTQMCRVLLQGSAAIAHVGRLHAKTTVCPPELEGLKSKTYNSIELIFDMYVSD